jgi:hypothetical protein
MSTLSQLTHSPADVLRWLLIDLGEGTDPGTEASWPIQATNEPDTPDNLIVLYDTSSDLQGRIQRTGEWNEFKGIAIQVRGADHPTAWAKAEAIRAAVDGDIHNTLITVDTSQYIVHSVTRRSGPISLGKEPGTSRFLFTINAVMSVRQIS